MKSHSDGQALAELALVLPILIVVVLGTAEFLRLQYDRTLLIIAARNAVRAATIELAANDAAQREVRKVLEANGERNLDSLRVHLDRWLGIHTLTVTYDAEVSPAVQYFMGSKVRLEAKAHMSRAMFAWY